MKVPFVSNSSDGKHCFEASLAMVVKYFKPEFDVSFENLDRITDKEPGKWTWPTAGMLWLLDNGFELKLVEDFDYEDFANRGEQYIIDKVGPEVARAQIANSDVTRELQYARRFAKLNLVDCRLPDFKEIKKLLSEGYLIICNVNSTTLAGGPGYSGHFVVVFEGDDKTVTIHDPGLPPKPSQKVSHSVFERAWAYPTPNEKNLLAVRLKS